MAPTCILLRKELQWSHLMATLFHIIDEHMATLSSNVTSST